MINDSNDSDDTQTIVLSKEEPKRNQGGTDTFSVHVSRSLCVRRPGPGKVFGYLREAGCWLDPRRAWRWAGWRRRAQPHSRPRPRTREWGEPEHDSFHDTSSIIKRTTLEHSKYQSMSSHLIQLQAWIVKWGFRTKELSPLLLTSLSR